MGEKFGKKMESLGYGVSSKMEKRSLIASSLTDIEIYVRYSFSLEEFDES